VPRHEEEQHDEGEQTEWVANNLGNDWRQHHLTVPYVTVTLPAELLARILRGEDAEVSAFTSAGTQLDLPAGARPTRSYSACVPQ
jgi:hypothetical protein